MSYPSFSKFDLCCSFYVLCKFFKVLACFDIEGYLGYLSVDIILLSVRDFVFVLPLFSQNNWHGTSPQQFSTTHLYVKFIFIEF